MERKPLFLLILPVFLMVFLLGIEQYYPKEEPLEEPDFTSEESIPVETEKKIPENYMKYTLVVGQTGDMTGGKENIYEEPDVNSDVVSRLEYNCAVLAKEEQNITYRNEWVYVDLLGAGEGYVRKEAVKVVDVAFGSEDPFAHNVIKTALSYLGNPFKMNGNSLEEGIDCSHFAAKMYAMNGMEIPDKPRKQRKEGLVVNNEERKPGDIIFYDRANNRSGHVGIYLGDGFLEDTSAFYGGFIINSTGHSGKTYPEGGIRIVCLKYPDRDHYEVLRFTDTEEEP